MVITLHGLAVHSMMGVVVVTGAPAVGLVTVGATILVSMVNVVCLVELLPAGSVMVAIGLLPILPPVPVQTTVPPVDGDGVQTAHGIVTVAHTSTVGNEILTTVPVFPIGGSAVPVLSVGAVLSTTIDGVWVAVFLLPAVSVRVMVRGVPS
jgi:hypothetical protein